VRTVRAPPQAVKETATPKRDMLLAGSLGPALLALLDSLAPAERVAFVLHNLFGMAFEEVAPIVGRSVLAARQLASRAHRRIEGVTVPDDDPERQREVVNALFAASRESDFGRLLALLDPDVVLRADAIAVAAAEGEPRAWGAPSLQRRARSPGGREDVRRARARGPNGGHRRRRLAQRGPRRAAAGAVRVHRGGREGGGDRDLRRPRLAAASRGHARLTVTARSRRGRPSASGHSSIRSENTSTLMRCSSAPCTPSVLEPRLDASVRNEPHERHQDVDGVGDPLADERQRDGGCIEQRG
jgi:ketosteroid isomerase-like protein